MRSGRQLLQCCCAVLAVILSSCAVPQVLWPQKDVLPSETVTGEKGLRVLIASRSSEYKEALVAALHQQLAAENIAQQTIGVDDLKSVDAGDYPAVVIINTCLAWGLDNDITSFLERQTSYENIILMTTSGEGDWLPDKSGRDFDAVSGASVLTNIDGVTRDLMDRIKKRLNP